MSLTSNELILILASSERQTFEQAAAAWSSWPMARRARFGAEQVKLRDAARSNAVALTDSMSSEAAHRRVAEAPSTNGVSDATDAQRKLAGALSSGE